jgi:hypothetical protein
MTTSQYETTKKSTTPTIADDDYTDAMPHKEGETAQPTSSEAVDLPLINTVYARSDEVRKVTVNPIQIKQSLESLKRNRALQKKGLG